MALLHPKQTKYQKHHKGKQHSVEKNSSSQLHFGSFGIQSVHSMKVSSALLEGCRRVLSREFRRTGQVWIRAFPDISLTKKPAEVRMGKGKGSHDSWSVSVHAGSLLFEMDGMPEEKARAACKKMMHKLPGKVNFVSVHSQVFHFQ